MQNVNAVVNASNETPGLRSVARRDRHQFNGVDFAFAESLRERRAYGTEPDDRHAQRRFRHGGGDIGETTFCCCWGIVKRVPLMQGDKGTSGINDVEETISARHSAFGAGAKQTQYAARKTSVVAKHRVIGRIRIAAYDCVDDERVLIVRQSKPAGQ